MLFLWLGGIAGGIAAVSMAPPIPPPGQCGHVVVGCEANANCTFGAANCSVIGAFQVPTDNGTAACCDLCVNAEACQRWTVAQPQPTSAGVDTGNISTCWLRTNSSGLANTSSACASANLAPAPAAVGFKWVGTWRGLHAADGGNSTAAPAGAAVRAGTRVGECGCSLIAPGWIVTAGHCAVRVLKHEKVDVKINFHGTNPHVERRVTHCIHADDDQDVAICALSAQVHAYPSVKVSPVVMKTGHPAEFVYTIGTRQGLKVVGPKKLEYEGNGDHLYVKPGGGMKAGDSGGPWVVERPHGSRRYYLVGVLHGSGIAGQPAFIRTFLDKHIAGISWEKPP